MTPSTFQLTRKTSGDFSKSLLRSFRRKPSSYDCVSAANHGLNCPLFRSENHLTATYPYIRTENNSFVVRVYSTDFVKFDIAVFCFHFESVVCWMQYRVSQPEERSGSQKAVHSDQSNTEQNVQKNKY